MKGMISDSEVLLYLEPEDLDQLYYMVLRWAIYGNPVIHKHWHWIIPLILIKREMDGFTIK